MTVITTCKGMFAPWFDALETCKGDERVLKLVQGKRISVFEGKKLMSFPLEDREFILSIL